MLHLKQIRCLREETVMKRQSRVLAAILFVFAFTAILTLSALSVNADAGAETDTQCKEDSDHA